MWTDPPQADVSPLSQVIVNDLDLTITNVATGQVTFPNGLTGRDALNNVEVAWLPPSLKEECYDVKVAGTRVVGFPRFNQRDKSGRPLPPHDPSTPVPFSKMTKVGRW